MRKTMTAMTVFACAALVALPAFAGNGAPSGAHYNLNIIGVENPKNADMTGSNRHSIFVALGKTGTVTSKIYLSEGPFQVCDGNAFDRAYDCSGALIGNYNGAVFQLPANTGECPTDLPDDPCWDVPTNYEIWVRGLGAPGGSATMTTCREASDGTTECSTEYVTVTSYYGGQGGKNTKFTNQTKKLTTVCLDTDDSGSCDFREGIFSNDLYEYLWEYANSGLRLAQLRFYEVVPVL